MRLRLCGAEHSRSTAELSYDLSKGEISTHTVCVRREARWDGRFLLAAVGPALLEYLVGHV